MEAWAKRNVCMCGCLHVGVYCVCLARRHQDVWEIKDGVNATNESEGEKIWINFSICPHAPCLLSVDLDAQSDARSEGPE